MTTNRQVRNPKTEGRSRGFTLPELMIGLAVGSMILAFAGSLWAFGSRSFVAMTNYTDLDNKSRFALDLMSRDIREASEVTGIKSTGTTKYLSVTNAVEGTSVTYIWGTAPRTLICRRPGQSDQVFLTECDDWNFQLYQRTPQATGGYVFYPATNSTGAYDLSLCKLVNMNWKCSRTILGNKINTESVQTAQVVLRNKQ